MNMESFRLNLSQSSKTKAIALAWLLAYALVAAAVGALLYQMLFTTMVIVPLAAEGVFVKSPWNTSSYWSGIVLRFAGLVIANVITYYLYIIPFIYKGDDPYTEEALLTYVVVVAQTVIAAVVMVIVRKLMKKRIKRQVQSY